MKKQVEQKIKNIRSNWHVWLFPIFAILISGWLVFDHFNQGGPTIKIFFDDASGIQAEKTRVRYRGVPIGTVKKISLTKDTKDAIVYIKLTSDAENFAVAGSKFWMVMPKVSAAGISGLETIFDGTYIAVEPGNPEGKTKLEFKGQLSPESNDSLENTSVYFIETSNAESISPGDSVTFRGIKVGSISKVALSKTAQVAVIQIDVQNKYVNLIRTNSVFWRKAGIKADLGLFNSEIKVNSFDSIMHGGIEFFTPNNPGAVAKAQSRYPLHGEAPKDSGKWNPQLEL